MFAHAYPVKTRVKDAASVVIKDLHGEARAIARLLNVLAFNLNRAGGNIPLARIPSHKSPTVQDIWEALRRTHDLTQAIVDALTSGEPTESPATRVLPEKIADLLKSSDPIPAPTVPMVNPRKVQRWGPRMLASMSRKELVMICGTLKINPFGLPDQSKAGLIATIRTHQEANR